MPNKKKPRKAATINSTRKMGSIVTRPASINPGGGVNPGIYKIK